MNQLNQNSNKHEELKIETLESTEAEMPLKKKEQSLPENVDIEET